jgi:hypothetical protein
MHATRMVQTADCSTEYRESNKIIMKLYFKIWLLPFLVTVFFSNTFSEPVIEEREGTVTFISAQYIYVKFNDMSGIGQGDTLFIKKGNDLIPELIIEHISTSSSACIRINNHEFKVTEKVIARVEVQINETRVTEVDLLPEVKLDNSQVTNSNFISRKPKDKSGLSGRFSIQSYSNFSNSVSSPDYQRWRYTLSLAADRISGTGLSFSSYINFNYRADNWSKVTFDIWQSLKIYDLALKYSADNSFNVTAGRSRNRKISNIGSIDGLQTEKSFGKFFAGVVVGSRPEFADLSVNMKLFEFGGYFGRTDTSSNGLMENNIAFMQQTNDFKTDRRFIYLQHSNNFLANTSFFISSEIDLYKKILGVESNELTLTGLFLSARYSPVRLFSASVSYDARKRVVYYETYKNFIDSLFENETRQGLNARTTFRLMNNLFIGLSGGYRFVLKDIKPTRNFGGHISYSAIPFIESSLSFNYTKLITNYTEGTTAGIRISRNLFNNKFDLSLGYRRSEYKFAVNKLLQNSISADLSGRVLNHLSMSLGYEGIFMKKQTSGRVLINLTAKF